MKSVLLTFLAALVLTTTANATFIRSAGRVASVNVNVASGVGHRSFHNGFVNHYHNGFYNNVGFFNYAQPVAVAPALYAQPIYQVPVVTGVAEVSPVTVSQQAVATTQTYVAPAVQQTYVAPQVQATQTYVAPAVQQTYVEQPVAVAPVSTYASYTAAPVYSYATPLLYSNSYAGVGFKSYGVGAFRFGTFGHNHSRSSVNVLLFRGRR